MTPVVWTLRSLVWREWAQHPWRHGVVLLAVALGVALAWSVHVINSSALAEFGAAVRQANGQPDLTLRGPREGFDETWLWRVQADADVAMASAVVEVDTFARQNASGKRVAVRVLGVDALQLAGVAPDLMPRPDPGLSPLATLDPTRAFVNAAAARQLGSGSGGTLELQSGATWSSLTLSGSIAADGAPLVVLDIAAAQALLEQLGRIHRIDIRLAAGADRAALLQRLALPSQIRAVDAGDGEQRISNLSRAYRVNLTVLALVALFVGSFLVFAVVALSVAQRTPALALLGVLGLTAGERRALVLGETAVLGMAGSTLGLALGTALAWAALQWLAGDLGGGYFPGVTPRLQLSIWAACIFFALGVASACVGAWVPARQAEHLQPAMALKGLGGSAAPAQARQAAWALALMGVGGLLALAPPIGGLPLAAYASVGALLLGGVALVPAMVDALLRFAKPPRAVLPLLAWRRAGQQRHTATAAVAGVVASLALSVALTVMVASFRDGVARWLDQVLPADLYARTAGGAQLADQVWFDDTALQRIQGLPGVQRVVASRVRALQLDPAQPAVALLARPLGDDAAQRLPMRAPPLAPRDGELGVYVSEAMVVRHGAAPGTLLKLPLPGGERTVRVLGVWRDYARQFGSVCIDLDRYQAVTGDRRLNELALWLAPGASTQAVGQALRALMPDPAMLDLASTGELREISLRIFDRSFAVTRYLQVVAVVIGLVGVAASFSAQVLARRKEFGLLSHLGFTRRQVLALVAAEAAAWMAAGVALGVALGLLISAVLVHVVNPQSFHWTMELRWPVSQLALLAGLVLVAGVATAAASARGATQRAAVMAVKEDW